MSSITMTVPTSCDRLKALAVVLAISCAISIFLLRSSQPHHDIASSSSRDSSSDATSPPVLAFPTQRLTSVAVCLAGGLRTFDLTWPSISQHLLAAYAPCDLFIRTPLDIDTHKLTLLRQPSLHVRHISIWVERQAVLQSRAGEQVLLGRSSRRGVQGLLQYFHQVEGCETMIAEWEKSHRQSRYTWVVRTRPDSYWTAMPAPAVTLTIAHTPNNTYVAPAGSRYFGVNDRFAASNRRTAELTLSRLSVLADLRRAYKARLNSEAALKQALILKGVRLKEVNLPFCVLSHHSCPPPTESCSTPVASLTESQGPLNGAKCRPCSSALFGRERTMEALQRLRRDCGRVRGDSRGVALCNASREWEEGWERVFDEFAGAAAAHVRLSVANRSLQSCTADLTALIETNALLLWGHHHVTVSYMGGLPASAMCEAAQPKG